MTRDGLAKWTKSTLDRYIDEKRGIGEFENYRPWRQVRESSSGRARRDTTWKTKNRIHHLFRDLERHYFYLCVWSDKVVDIREQKPLLDVELAMEVAKEIGMEYPVGKDETPWIFTSTFQITKSINGELVQSVRSVEYSKSLQQKSLIQDLELMRRYYKIQGVTDWDIVTEKNIPDTLAENIAWFHNDYWLDDEGDKKASDLRVMADTLKVRLQQKDIAIHEVATALDREMNIEGSGTSLKLFRHLVARKEVVIDLVNKPILGYSLTNEILDIVF